MNEPFLCEMKATVIFFLPDVFFYFTGPVSLYVLKVFFFSQCLFIDTAKWTFYEL